MHKDKSFRKYGREVKIRRMLWQFLKGPQIFLVLLPSWNVVYDLEPGQYCNCLNQEYGVNHIMYLLRLSRKWLCSFYLTCWHNCSWSPDLTWKKSKYHVAVMFEESKTIWRVQPQLFGSLPVTVLFPAEVPDIIEHAQLSLLCPGRILDSHNVVVSKFWRFWGFFLIARGNWNRCD